MPECRSSGAEGRAALLLTAEQSISLGISSEGRHVVYLLGSVHGGSDKSTAGHFDWWTGSEMAVYFIIFGVGLLAREDPNVCSSGKFVPDKKSLKA